jgi:hypothetical protein
MAKVFFSLFFVLKSEHGCGDHTVSHRKDSASRCEVIGF